MKTGMGRVVLVGLAVALVAWALCGYALAADTIKIGVIYP